MNYNAEIVKLFSAGGTSFYYSFSNGKAGIPDYKRRQFITTESGGWVKYWNIDDLSLDRQWQLDSADALDRTRFTDDENRLHILSLCPEKDLLAVGAYHGSIYLVDAESGKNVKAPLIPNDIVIQEKKNSADGNEGNEITALQFFAKGNRLLAGHQDGSLRIWNTLSGDQIGKLANPTKSKAKYICIHSESQKAILIMHEPYGLKSNILIVDLSAYF